MRCLNYVVELFYAREMYSQFYSASFLLFLPSFSSLALFFFLNLLRNADATHNYKLDFLITVNYCLDYCSYFTAEKRFNFDDFKQMLFRFRKHYQICGAIFSLLLVAVKIDAKILDWLKDKGFPSLSFLTELE